MAPRQETYVYLSTGADMKNIGSLSPRLKSMWNVTFGILMFLAISIGFLMYIQSGYYMKSNPCGKKSNCFPVDDYAVFTEGCRIFDFAPFEFVHLLFFNSEPDVDLPSCDPTNRGELVKATETHLYVDDTYTQNYTADEIKCCYQPYDRRVTPRTADNKYRDHIEGNLIFATRCHDFDKPVVIEHQFVYVKCMNASNHRVYEDYFTFAVDRKDVNYVRREENSTDLDQKIEDGWTKIEGKISDENAFNVLILGFDSMSRLNFLRQMPATASFFEDNGGISMLGYNKVGYNTFPNLVPVLTGLNVSQLRKSCWPTRVDALDDCPFVWKLFRERGYFTAYAEDGTFTSTFTYRKTGFREQPVDYYVKPYYLMSESQLKVVALNPPTSIQCLGLRKNLDRFVGVVRGFASNMRNRRTFGLFWYNGMSHDFLNVGRETDRTFRSTLDALKEEGALDHTVVIALSDHGMRWGKFRATFQGFSEERLPLATILLPEKFKAKFPRAVENLRNNAKRLSVPFDLHETLLDILTVSRLPDLNRHIFETDLNSSKSRGISLFQPIPEKRTCDDAGAPPEFCACSDLKLIEDESLHRRLGRKAVVSLNKLLRNVSESCAKLNLDSVDTVFEQTSAMGSNKPFSIRNREFFVRFTTTPGKGSFEALMQITGRKHNEIVEPLGVISRINMYHNDSYCIEDEILKLYCYCLDRGNQLPEGSVEDSTTVDIIDSNNESAPNVRNSMPISSSSSSAHSLKHHEAAMSKKKGDNNAWPVTHEPEYLEKRRRFWELERLRESVLDYENLSGMEKEIHDAHKEALRRGHFTYMDPAGGGVVETRYKHYLTGLCCGTACRHCIFNFYNVPKYLKASKTFNSSFWTDIAGMDGPKEPQLDLKKFSLRRLRRETDSTSIQPSEPTAR